MKSILKKRATSQKENESNALQVKERKIGVSKTVTKNTGNYENVKIGYWTERTVPDTERDVKIAAKEMSVLIDDLIKAELDDLFAEEEKPKAKTKLRR
jgi:hypothetical protein